MRPWLNTTDEILIDSSNQEWAPLSHETVSEETASAAAGFAEHRWTHPPRPVTAVTGNASLHDEEMAFGAKSLENVVAISYLCLIIPLTF